MADTMRGVYTNLTEIRRKVFREVARIAYQDRTDEETGAELDRLPYDIIPGEVATYRESIFLERAIVAQPSSTRLPYSSLRRSSHTRSTTSSR